MCTGFPVARHMFMVFPYDTNTFTLDSQYMLGEYVPLKDVCSPLLIWLLFLGTSWLPQLQLLVLILATCICR